MKSVVLLLAIVALVAADGWWTDCSQNPVFSYSQLDVKRNEFVLLFKIGKKTLISV